MLSHDTSVILVIHHMGILYLIMIIRRTVSTAHYDILKEKSHVIFIKYICYNCSISFTIVIVPICILTFIIGLYVEEKT